MKINIFAKIGYEVARTGWLIRRRIEMFGLCRRLYGTRRAVREFIHGAKP